MKHLVCLEESGLLSDQPAATYTCSCKSCAHFTESSRRLVHSLVFWGILLPPIWIVLVTALSFMLFYLPHREMIQHGAFLEDILEASREHREKRSHMKLYLEYSFIGMATYGVVVSMLWIMTKAGKAK